MPRREMPCSGSVGKAAAVRSVVMRRSALGPLLALCLVPAVAVTACGAGGEDEDALAAQQLRDSAAAARERQDQLAAEDARAATAEEASAAAEAESEAEAKRLATQPMEVEPAAAGASSASAGPGAPLTAADRASFAKLAASLPGRQGIAVSGLGLGQQVYRAGDFTSGVAWSTSKVPVAMAAISAGTANSSDLRAAITSSDNAAAERLFASLGSPSAAAAKATAQLRAAGDGRTTVQSQRLRSGYTAFGQTSWALTDQARFAAGMRCTGPGRKVAGLMRQTVSGQRWGIGTLGASAALKGGWGPGITAGQADGWLDRQLGIATIGGKPVAIAIATTGGSHESATPTLTRLAQWARSNVGTTGLPATPSC